MHRTIIGLILVTSLLAMPTQALPDGDMVSLEFSGPSKFWGNLDASTEETTLAATLLREGIIRVYLEAGTEVVETYDDKYHFYAQTPVTGHSTHLPQFVPLQERYQIKSPGWIELEPTARPVAFLMESRGLGPAPLIKASTLEWNERDAVEYRTPYGYELSLAFRDEISWFKDGVMLTTNDKSPVSLDETQVLEIEWTGTKVTCIHLAPCPSSDDQGNSSIDGNVQIDHNVRVSVKDPKRVQILTDAGHFIALSPEWSISGPMAARLPKASGDDCQAIGCDGVKTIRLDGEFTLEGLKKSGDDRLSASIHGDVQNLILDEQPVDPSLLWAIGASTVAATAIVAAILSKLGVLGLFTRISPEKALEHPRRQIIYEYIAENPGTTFREMVRNTGIPAGTTRHHLNIMRRCDLVVEKPHRSTLRFFENHGKFDGSWDTVVMLREPALKELHGWLRRHPESPQKVIVAAMAERGHSRGTTQHRLCRLEDACLVSSRHQGRLKLYTAHAQPQRRPPRPDEWNGLDASWPPLPYS